MQYLPPFDRIRSAMNITAFRGQLTTTMSYDDVLSMIRTLLRHIEIDEVWYLSRYPDVADAIRTGAVASARAHFFGDGYFEGRWPSPITVDEAWYLAEYPEIAKAIADGLIDSAQQHFEENGYKEGRRPWPDPDAQIRDVAEPAQPEPAVESAPMTEPAPELIDLGRTEGEAAT